jgi:Caspase domain
MMRVDRANPAGLRFRCRRRPRSRSRLAAARLSRFPRPGYGSTASGPYTTAFIYLSGYGLQLEGENYFVPIDAKIARDTDVPAEAVRVSDYTRPLAALRLNASIMVLDAARVNPFASSGQPLAGGLALVEPNPGMLIAFNAAPGTVAPEGQGPYGPYAQALAEMMREGGLQLAGNIWSRRSSDRWCRAD